MSNTARTRRRVVLTEFRDRRIAEASIEIELPDGPPVVIPPPDLWPDDIDTVRDDLREMGRLILGDTEWDRFVAAGGTGKLLNALFVEAQGVSTGEA